MTAAKSKRATKPRAPKPPATAPAQLNDVRGPRTTPTDDGRGPRTTTTDDRGPRASAQE